LDERHKVVIVGSGFSGLGMAIQLRKAGIEDFVILEKADDIGGTWRENNYPGCACDIPSHMYSYSYAPKWDWTRMYAPQGEIWDYLRACAEKYGLTKHLRFGEQVATAHFDEARAEWRITTARGTTYVGQALVLGVGAQHRPSIPDLPGAATFTGEAFHSAQWNHDYDVAGKRVAVIGTGASAIQFVPQLATQADQVHVYQRTAPWILPKPDRPITDRERRAFRAVPALQRAYRAAIYLALESRAVGFVVSPKAMRVAERVSRRHLRKQVADEALRDALTPNFTMGCKRVLISNDYYPSLTRENVALVTEAIASVRPSSIVTTDGVEREVDAIVYGTGFHVTDTLASMQIVGAGGRSLDEAWRDGPEAYLGISVAGFPNLFILVGPNTILGHSSMVFMIEAQVKYVLRALRRLAEPGRLEVLPHTQARFNSKIQKRLRRTVWSTGCRSWYLDSAGVNRALWPGFTVSYWLRTRFSGFGGYARAGTAEPGTAGSAENAENAGAAEGMVP
jgi:cation diffusion facilitator CzcD-associated flavoprotein CzcO